MTEPTTKPLDPIAEEEWSRRPNSILEAHPYLCGYAFLATLVILIFATRLTSFAISLLFLYLVTDFLTNDVRRRVRFLPKALLFSILYIAVLSILTVLIWKVIPDVIRRLPSVAQEIQTQTTEQVARLNQRWGLSDYIDADEVQKTIISVTTAVVPRLYARLTRFSKGFIFFLFACVVNLVLYHNLAKIDAVFARRPGSLMAFLYRFSPASSTSTSNASWAGRSSFR